jgi:hypothetical protein
MEVLDESNIEYFFLDSTISRNDIFDYRKKIFNSIYFTKSSHSGFRTSIGIKAFQLSKEHFVSNSLQTICHL